MARHIPKYMNTEENFLLSSLNEFVKVWASGNQAFMNVKCENGRATLSLGFQLGAPQSPHNYFPNQNFFPNQTRQKGPTRITRDNERAAKHQAKKNARTTDSVDEINPTQPHKSAAPVENSISNKVPPSQSSHSNTPCTLAAAPAAESQHSNPNIPPPPPALQATQPPPPPISAASAETTQHTGHTTVTPPSVRPTSLLFPPDPPKKQSQGTPLVFNSQPVAQVKDVPYTIEALHKDFPVAKQFTHEIQEVLVEGKNNDDDYMLEYNVCLLANTVGLTVPGLTIGPDCTLVRTPAAGATTASVNSEQVTTATINTSTFTLNENTETRSVVKNLIPLFQPFTPSPPSSHLLHLNHSAVLLLPDHIQAKLRRKVKKETNGYDTKDEKVRTFIHRTIMGFTACHG